VDRREASEVTATGSVLVDDPSLRAQLESTPPSSRGKVLVVEAVPGCADVLQRTGFHVERAADGVDASQWLATSRFDAVLTEVFLPALSGIELLRYAREHDQDLPILLMTSAPDVETASQAVEHGAFQYLLKPLSEDRLVGCIERAITACRVSRARSAVLRAASEPPTARHDFRPVKEFGAVLRSLFMVYQPILTLDGQLFAVEALVRSEEPTFETAPAILDLAEALEQFQMLGRTVRERVDSDLGKLAPGSAVFVNLHAEDVLDDALLDPAGPLGRVAHRVVLEITERAALAEISEAQRRMALLREMGFRIALDDLGAGYAGLTNFTQLRPDIVKLDQTLVRGIDTDSVKRRLVASLVGACRDIGTVVVAEGIETNAERDVLVDAGCDLFQGYLLGRPARL
jgi:EAL domain-containing protein (putative c-di-GMP-specific phosphodiesterase class I)